AGRRSSRGLGGGPASGPKRSRTRKCPPALHPLANQFRPLRRSPPEFGPGDQRPAGHEQENTYQKTDRPRARGERDQRCARAARTTKSSGGEGPTLTSAFARRNRIGGRLGLSCLGCVCAAPAVHAGQRGDEADVAAEKSSAW